jgi:hypothetical protein
VVYWQLAKLGVECMGVAPSLIPQRAGDRVKPTGSNATGVTPKNWRGGIAAAS